MGYDHAAPRRKVELELNDDLLRQATAISPDLAKVVERLLAKHVERSELAAYLEASNGRTDRLGSWADDLLVDESGSSTWIQIQDDFVNSSSTWSSSGRGFGQAWPQASCPSGADVITREGGESPCPAHGGARR